MVGTVAILLAAGESRRMSRPKALLPWRGGTLLEHQVSSLLEAGVQRVVVVLGHQAGSLSPMLEGMDGVAWTVNADFAQGKTTSIKAGLAALGPEEPAAVLILNVDQPRSAGTIRELLRRHRAGGRLITLPTHGGKGGHPVVLDRLLLGELRTIREETRGLKALVRAHRDSTCRAEMEASEVLWDLNTPEDYQKALLDQGSAGSGGAP